VGGPGDPSWSSICGGWLATQFDADPAGVIATPGLLSLGDLMELPVDGHAELRDPPHKPVTHPRLQACQAADIEQALPRFGL